MAAEDIYQARIMPQPVAAMPLASPESKGAGIGRALEQAGDVVHRTGLRDYQIQRQLTADRELTEASARLADRTGGLRASTARLRAEYSSGHLLAVEDLLQQDRDTILDGITDHQVRNQVERQLKEQDARVRSDEEIFALGKGIERNGELAKRTLSTLDNQVSNADDPIAALADATEQWAMFAGGLSLIDDIQRESLAREGAAKLTTSMLERVGTANPDVAEAMLKTGRFNDLLTEQQMGRAQQAVTLGRRAQDVAAREAEQAQARVAREAQKAAAERLDAIRVQIDNGDPPSVREISTAINAGREAGVPEADLLKAGYLAEDAQRATFFRGMSTAQLEARAGPLRLRQDAGQLDAAGERELTQLERTIDARDRKDEEELGTLWRSGPSGQNEVLTKLRTMPRSERLRAAQFDPRIGILASLAPVSAEAARQGAGIRKARPKDFMPVEEEGKEGNPALARDTFNRMLGPAMVNSLGDSYDDVLNTALDLFVGSQASGGSRGGWSEAGFAKAVRIVFGSSKRRDGKYQGGIDYVRGRMTQLPDLWTAPEFDMALSRQDFAASGAVYSNGQPVDNADVLRNYRAIVDSEGDDGTIRYRLEDASGRALRSKAGGNFNLIVTRSPRGR